MNSVELKFELKEIESKINNNLIKQLIIDDKLSEIDMFKDSNRYSELTNKRTEILYIISSLERRKNTINMILEKTKNI